MREAIIVVKIICVVSMTVVRNKWVLDTFGRQTTEGFPGVGCAVGSAEKLAVGMRIVVGRMMVQF